jgi:F0F1-type ATP synthase assembly protein I
MIGIEKEIEKIKERNAKVEADKAWELSNTRRIVIGASIYVLAAIIFFAIRAPDPFINALIPAIGFVLSTATFSIFRDFWVKNIYSKRR